MFIGLWVLLCNLFVWFINLCKVVLYILICCVIRLVFCCYLLCLFNIFFKFLVNIDKVESGVFSLCVVLVVKVVSVISFLFCNICLCCCVIRCCCWWLDRVNGSIKFISNNIDNVNVNYILIKCSCIKWLLWWLCVCSGIYIWVSKV